MPCMNHGIPSIILCGTIARCTDKTANALHAEEDQYRKQRTLCKSVYIRQADLEILR